MTKYLRGKKKSWLCPEYRMIHIFLNSIFFQITHGLVVGGGGDVMGIFSLVFFFLLGKR